MSQQCNNHDVDPNIFEELDDEGMQDVELNADVSLAQELDDAFAYEYFRKFEPNPNYDRNALPPDDDGSIKSSRALRNYCKERGLSYIRQNGTEQPARQIREACACRRLCYMKFLDDVRNKLLTNFLGLSDRGQFMFLSSHIASVAVQRPRFKHCPKKSLHIYHLPSNSGRVQVCMRMFVNTLDITDKKLRILNEKIVSANQSTTHEPNDDVTPLQSASNCDEEESEREEDSEPYDSHGSIDFIEIPLMRDLGNMEEYFLRYETDADFHSRLEDLILQPKIGKQTAKKRRIERQYRKAKGYSYIRHGTGTEAPARKLQPACSCRLMCGQNITNDARQVLLNNLLNLSIEGQENFIYSHMHLKTSTLQRNFMDHFLPTTTGLVKVCKAMFLNTFDLSDKKMRLLLAKKRRENQEVLAAEDENPKGATVDLEPGSTRRKVAACEEDDTGDDVPKKEADDDIEIEHSYDLLETESEDGSNNSNVAFDEESVPALQETLEIPEQYNCTVVSNSDPEVALDDAFLNQYFYPYETNFGQEESANNKGTWKKNWVHTDADNTFQPCSCVMYGCSSWFTKDLHQKMFTRYSRLSTLNKKRFLYRHITKENKRRNNKYHSRRSFSQYYYLPTKKGHIKVCKVMFMNTFKVSERTLRSIVGSEKFVEPSEENISEEENSYVEEELDEISCDVAQKDADEITDSDSDSEKNSLPLETLKSPHFPGGSDEGVKTDTGDETEIGRSHEAFKPELEDGSNENNSMAVDEELDILALNEPMENNEKGNCIFDTMSQQEEESDDVFLDQYFYRYETNFGKEEPTKNRDKSMSKCWSFADESPSEPCTCVMNNCSSWFTEELRQKMFSRYARLSPLNKKRFLYRHIRKENKRRNNKYQSRRNFSNFYFVPTKKGYAKVCKVMFMNTFKVTDKRLRTIVYNEKISDPSEETTNEDHTCIKLDPDDFLIDIDENFLGEVSNDISSSGADKTDQLNSMIEIDPESCSTNQYSNVTDDSTESCNEDDNLPSTDIDNVVGVAATGSKQRPVVELDDDFLAEYFNRYETNLENPGTVIGKPRKIWIKHDTSGAILPPCSCLRQCYALYPDDVRRKIYTRFAKLTNLNQKRFLFRHIRLDNPLKKKSVSSRRQKTWFYYLPAKSGHVKICRVMFMSTFKVTDKKLRNLVQRKQFPEGASDDDDNDQNVQHVSTNVRYGSPCDDLSEEHNLRTELIDNASNPFSENSKEEHSEYENYFAEVAESAVEPLLSILGCSVANPFADDASTVAELDENFLDEYFHPFGSHVAGQNLGTPLGSHGNTFPAPKILPPIACACHRKCHTKFPDKIRQLILDRYAALSAENRIHFLTRHVKKETPLHSVDEQSAQSLTCLYYFPSKSGHVRVCNIMFLNTFNINEKQLRELIFCEVGSGQDDGNAKIKTEPELPVDIKIENESEAEMILADYDYGQKDDLFDSPPEQLLTEDRTCDQPAPVDDNEQMCMPGTSRQNETNSKQPGKVNTGAIRFAKEHICSFPRITSHFCQAVNKTKYLSCFLDVTAMYIAYIKACSETSKEPVPSKVYTAILQKERTKDPALPSTCDACQHEETLDPGEDNTMFWYENA